MLNANELDEEQLYRLARRSTKRQFLAQVTEPQAFVNALQELGVEAIERQRVGN